jgi:ABC-type glycerol-3-phosphate transport system substrate-binding protein
MTTFRVGLLFIFGFFIIIGTLMFAGIIPVPGSTSNVPAVPLLVWGTLPPSAMRPVQELFSQNLNRTFTLTYKQVSKDTIRSSLLESFAAKQPPDLLLFPSEVLLSISDLLSPFSEQTLSARNFRDTFVESGEIFLTENGAFAIPALIDPLVLYWNRDVLRTREIISPPTTWEEFYTLASKITDKDSTGNIGQGLLTVALGESGNVSWFKDILATLFLQGGDPIVSRTSNNLLIPSLGGGGAGTVVSAAARTITFYTNFSNPESPYYTWTSALPNSQDAFLGEKLAFYFGRASDYNTLRTKNPHLNFDVAMVPQAGSTRSTYATVYGFGLPKESSKQVAAASAALYFSSSPYQVALAQGALLPPARKDLLASTPGDPIFTSFYRSSLIAKSWLDPDPEKTNNVFGALIRDVSSGRAVPNEAVSRAVTTLQEVLIEFNQRNNE